MGVVGGRDGGVPLQPSAHGPTLGHVRVSVYIDGVVLTIEINVVLSLHYLTVSLSRVSLRHSSDSSVLTTPVLSGSPGSGLIEVKRVRTVSTV